mgnify:CR=1 FL=1
MYFVIQKMRLCRFAETDFYTRRKKSYARYWEKEVTWDMNKIRALGRRGEHSGLHRLRDLRTSGTGDKLWSRASQFSNYDGYTISYLFGFRTLVPTSISLPLLVPTGLRFMICFKPRELLPCPKISDSSNYLDYQNLCFFKEKGEVLFDTGGISVIDSSRQLHPQSLNDTHKVLIFIVKEQKMALCTRPLCKQTIGGGIFYDLLVLFKFVLCVCITVFPRFFSPWFKWCCGKGCYGIIFYLEFSLPLKEDWGSEK